MFTLNLYGLIFKYTIIKIKKQRIKCEWKSIGLYSKYIKGIISLEVIFNLNKSP